MAGFVIEQSSDDDDSFRADDPEPSLFIYTDEELRVFKAEQTRKESKAAESFLRRTTNLD